MTASAPPRPLEMLAVGELEPPQAGDVLVSFSLSPTSEAVCAWASAEDAARLRGRTAKGSPQTLLPPPGATLRVTVDDWQRPGSGRASRPARRDLRELRDVLPANPSVHLMPDGETLVVGSRAARRGGDPQHNAVVFGSDGRVARSACLGDGVSQVMTTATGQIWVGYFDEGVFGNFGWGGGGDSTPIGAPGWNRFDKYLRLGWSHPDPEEGEIADCYAMTLSGDRCYVCPYTDWPILSADEDGHFRRVKNDVGGAHEILVGSGFGTYLIGGYQERRARVVAGVMTQDSLHVSPQEGQLVIAGQPWNGGGLMATRDAVLNAVVDGVWYVLSSVEIDDELEVTKLLETVDWGPRRPRGR